MTRPNKKFSYVYTIRALKNWYNRFLSARMV